jgi:hypothetical protein
MKSIVRRAIVAGLVATAGAGAALLFTSGAQARILDVYILAVAAIAMLALYRTARLVARPTPSSFELALARLRTRPPAPRTELAEERDVMLSRLNAFHFHIRVRPMLREFAQHRLRSRFGVDLDREPERARELVATHAWRVIAPDAAPPGDRLARGPSLDEQRLVVEELERLGS